MEQEHGRLPLSFGSMVHAIVALTGGFGANDRTTTAASLACKAFHGHAKAGALSRAAPALPFL